MEGDDGVFELLLQRRGGFLALFGVWAIASIFLSLSTLRRRRQRRRRGEVDSNLVENGLTYRVVKHGEIWRIPFSVVTYTSILHFIFDAIALLTVSVRAVDTGTLTFLTQTVCILFCSGLMQATVYVRLERLTGGGGKLYSHGVTQVVCGHMLLLCSERTQFDTALFPGLMMSTEMSVVFFFFLAHMMLEHSSAIGNISGIIVACLVHFGALSWLDAYWTFWLHLSLVCATMVSLRATTDRGPSFIEVEVWPFPWPWSHHGLPNHRFLTGEVEP
eukprot:g807.t1